MYSSQQITELTERFSARNYAPKPVVIVSAEGAVVTDPEGRSYYDMLSAYSAHNFGHRHPEIVAAAKAQLDKCTLTSRAFYSENLGEFCSRLADFTGKDMVLPMNTGAEAVETALKAARLWGNRVKGVENGRQEIITCSGNFHGRTISIVSFSTDPQAKDGYGPYCPGFRTIPYGDARALRDAITPDTVAFLAEPIQGEAGIIIPPDGWLTEARDICTENNVLFLADEVQTGFARTGDLFACLHENVIPDIYIMGKALGGGIMPLSAIAADKDILGLFTPGSHGSTFGGNPLACACGIKAMEILRRDDYPRMAREKGVYFMNGLKKIRNPEIKEIRGRGLLIGVEFAVNASDYVKACIREGVLCKETHERTIRFAPPIPVSYEELDDALARIGRALSR